MKRTSLCQGWWFSRNDEEFQPVVVPHDAMLDNPRGPGAAAGSASGFYYGARYRYRNTFDLDLARDGEVCLIEFEGIYRNASIFVNGRPLEAPPYGFVPFFIDASSAVHDGANTIEVMASNADQPDCRWYSGAGLHRPVWLWQGPEHHIAPEAIKVRTLSIDPARIEVSVEVAAGLPRIEVFDEFDRLVARGSGRRIQLEIAEALLWSAEHPHLYRLEASLVEDGSVIDTAQTRFGIRTLEWSTTGLFVNGKKTLLRGGCIHSDNGILGAASWPTSEKRRVKLMKQAGFNALRIAHNPASASLLDACDEQGVYVMDESWDMWFNPKSAHDYSNDFLEWCDFDLTRLVSRDYNHPSVIMYSIGNEVSEPIAKAGVALERSMVELVHSLDPTRPVTCGINLTMLVMERAGRGWYGGGDRVASSSQGSESAARGSMLFNLAAQASGTGMTYLANMPGADKLVSPGLDALDIAGYNYASARYRIDQRKHPNRIMVGSETFPHELAQNWKKVKAIDSLIGDFMWAGWDYLGEAGAGAWAYTAQEAGFSKPWPWLVAGSGAFDILGIPGAPAALAGAVWNARKNPVICVRPVNIMKAKTYKATWRGSDAISSWSWQDCDGWPCEVEVYDGRAHSVRLMLNGEEVGTRKVRNFVARFTLDYQQGTLSAISLDAQGHQIGTDTLTSAQGRLHLDLQPEQSHFKAGDVAYVSVRIAGSNGVVESNADELLHAQVEGGLLLAFGSARPATEERFTSGTYTAYRGYALAVVYRNEPGTSTLRIRGANLGEQTVQLVFR